MPDRTRRSRRSGATGRVTSTVVLVTIPWRWAARMPSLTPRVSPKSSAFTMSRRTSVPRGSLDRETRDRGRRVPRGQCALGVEGADVVEPLVADPGKGLGLAGDHLRREPRRLHLRERGLPAEKAEDREGEPAARLEVGAGARDRAVEDLRAVEDAVVGHYAVYTARMSAWAFAALARIAKLIASRTSSSVAPARLAPARSRFAQWVLPTARFAAR